MILLNEDCRNGIFYQPLSETFNCLLLKKTEYSVLQSKINTHCFSNSIAHEINLKSSTFRHVTIHNQSLNFSYVTTITEVPRNPHQLEASAT